MIFCSSSVIRRAEARNNRDNGMYLYKCNRTRMTNTSSLSNGRYGISLDTCINTALRYVFAMSNKYSGMNVETQVWQMC